MTSVEGGDALSPEMRSFIEEAKASGVTRCPIRDIEEQISECPVDFKTVPAEDAKAAVEEYMARERAGKTDDDRSNGRD